MTDTTVKCSFVNVVGNMSKSRGRKKVVRNVVRRDKMFVSVNTITGAVRQCDPDFQGDGIWGAVVEVAPVTSCEWYDGGDYWESACGNAWVFSDGGLKENNMVFCNKCGGKIIEKLDR